MIRAASLPDSTSSPAVTFVDVAQEAGLTAPNVWGGVERKKYIIEGKGSGIAFFDYDNDGWLDIYMTNGIRFGETYTPQNAPTSHLYKNNRDGTFSDVTARSGLARTGWGTGYASATMTTMAGTTSFAAFGDTTFYSTTMETEPSRTSRGRRDFTRNVYDGAQGVPGWTSIATASWIYSSATLWNLTWRKSRFPGQASYCQWKGVPVFCGPKGLPGGSNILYHNNGDGTFTDVSEKAGILKPGPRYSITAVSCDFDNDGWPDIFVAVDSEENLLFRNKHDGTFEEIAMMAGVALSEDGRAQACMGVAVGDYDCDGWFDLFVTNFEEDTCELYRNNGDGTFADVTFPAGVNLNTHYVNWGAGIRRLR